MKTESRPFSNGKITDARCNLSSRAHGGHADMSGAHSGPLTPTALRWAVKPSLVSYVRGAAAGTVSVEDGASEPTDGVFQFPAAEGPGTRGIPTDDYAFRGGVLLSGHRGVLDLPLRNPCLSRAEHVWSLTVDDPDAADARIVFATVQSLTVGDDPTVLHGAGTALTEGGAGLFFGPYEEGTPLDDPAVLLAARVRERGR